MSSASLSCSFRHSDYQLVEAAIGLLCEQQLEQPAFDRIACELNVSEGHLRRLFRRWTGVTPKQFLQVLTVERAKSRLKESASLMDAALDVGLSGPSRLHDHFVTLEAMTPAQYRDQGANLHIRHGLAETPFGLAFIAYTDRGVCQFTFVKDARDGQAEHRLRRHFSAAQLSRDDSGAARCAASFWETPPDRTKEPRLSLWVKGTNFQVQVWKALLNIPTGAVVDYSTIARQIDRPTATRAVASAIGANPVAVLIPCHRVIRRDGGLGGYHWGLPRKQMLLVKERSPH